MSRISSHCERVVSSSPGYTGHCIYILIWNRLVSHLIPLTNQLFCHRPIHVLLHPGSAQGISQSRGCGLLWHYQPKSKPCRFRSLLKSFSTTTRTRSSSWGWCKQGITKEPYYIRTSSKLAYGRNVGWFGSRVRWWWTAWSRWYHIEAPKEILFREAVGA